MPPKNTSKPAPAPSLEAVVQEMKQEAQAAQDRLHLSEALGIISFLNERKVLCTRCGYRLATLENQIHSVCSDCASGINQTFNSKLKKAGSLDEVLCAKLTEWAAAMFQGNR